MRSDVFGYSLIMGKISVNEDEARLVRKIFDLSIAGKSLSQIAESIKSQSTGVNINKYKVARILTDKRYLGDDKYMQIIEMDTYNKANEAKSDRTCTPLKNDKAEILGLSIKVKCPECGVQMRRYNVEKHHKQYWKCSNDECRKIIYVNDEYFIEELKDIMFELSSEDFKSDQDYIQKDLKTATLEKSVIDQIDDGARDKDRVKSDVIKLAEMLYSDIPNTGYTRMKINDSLSTYDESKYLETINAISLRIEFDTDNSIYLVLRDGSKIRRKKHHADRTKNNTLYSAYEANY